MDNDQGPKLSPLSRTVKCGEQLLEIEIREDGEGGWGLSVTNLQRVTSQWTESFDTEQAALDEAMKTIEEEGPDGFSMETPYKDVLH